MRLEIFQGENGQWYWRARGGNHEIVCQSEGFTKRSSAIRAARGFLVRVRTGLVEVVVAQ
jgi:uncharacterized protein YegP (UPF0339 family)